MTFWLLFVLLFDSEHLIIIRGHFFVASERRVIKVIR